MRWKTSPTPVILLILCGLLFGCSPDNPADPVEISTPSLVARTTTPFLTPYQTPTASSTPMPADPSTATSFPTPTATPRTHVVKKGEDMFGIAYRYGITLDELKAANPDVNPNILSVDTVLVIPASAAIAESSTPSMPTAAAVILGEPYCSRTLEEGLWCFFSVDNMGELPLESVSASIRLADGDGIQVAERTALTPLNIVPAGGSLPLLVYFPPPVPDPFQVNAVLMSAFPAQSAEDFYVPAVIEDLAVEIDPEGLSAIVTGDIHLPPGKQNVSRIWAAVTAYDESGQIIGVRRWENPKTTATRTVIPFSVSVYSIGGKIAAVNVLVEAKR